MGDSLPWSMYCASARHHLTEQGVPFQLLRHNVHLDLELTRFPTMTVKMTSGVSPSFLRKVEDRDLGISEVSSMMMTLVSWVRDWVVHDSQT